MQYHDCNCTLNIITVFVLCLDVSLSDSLIETKLPSTLTSLICRCTKEDDLPFMEPLIDILSTFIEKGKKSVIAKVTFCLLKSMHRQIIV